MNRIWCALLLVVVCGTGCGDNGGTPSLEPGTYVATTLVITPEGEAPIDLLDAGGSLVIGIAVNLETMGRFLVPGELDADMAGTAVVNGATVTFDQEADTFIRDLTFDIEADRLLAGEVLGDVEYMMVLERQ